jgi:hypothetical protein
MSNERMEKQTAIVRMEEKVKKETPWKDRSDKSEEDLKVKGIKN